MIKDKNMRFKHKSSLNLLESFLDHAINTLYEYKDSYDGKPFIIVSCFNLARISHVSPINSLHHQSIEIRISITVCSSKKPLALCYQGKNFFFDRSIFNFFYQFNPSNYKLLPTMLNEIPAAIYKKTF